VFVGFHYGLCICIYTAYFPSSSPLNTTSFPPLHPYSHKVSHIYSCPIIIINIIILNLGSTNEQEYSIFGFLRLVYLTQHDDLQFHSFSASETISFFFMSGWHISYFLYPFFCCWAPWLISQFDCCVESCNKHVYKGISLIYWFTYFRT
jgi:hypothetical protein